MTTQTLPTRARANPTPGTACCIHIGMPKTATTTLQQHMFHKHSQVKYLGKMLDHGWCDRDIGRLLKMALSPGPLAESELRNGARRFQETVERNAGMVPLISKEGLTAGGTKIHKIRARRFSDLFGPCRVVIVLRNPLDWVKSMYAQKLKGAHVGHDIPFGRRPRFFGFQAWLDGQWKLKNKGALSHLQYADTIDIYANVFGKENVGVFMFEQFREDSRQFLQEFCSFIGIDSEEAYRLVQREQSNLGWTRTQTDRLRTIEASAWKSTLFRFGGRKLRLKMLDVPQRGTIYAGSKFRPELPEPWRQRIIELTRDGNRRLIDNWGLPLDEHDYPCP